MQPGTQKVPLHLPWHHIFPWSLVRRTSRLLFKIFWCGSGRRKVCFIASCLESTEFRKLSIMWNRVKLSYEDRQEEVIISLLLDQKDYKENIISTWDLKTEKGRALCSPSFLPHNFSLWNWRHRRFWAFCKNQGSNLAILGGLGVWWRIKFPFQYPIFAGASL